MPTLRELHLMAEPITRRTALKLIATATVVGAASGAHTAAAASAPPRAPDGTTADAWSRTHDRVWLGGEFWANPMEDWQIADGGAECRSLGGNRSIHSLTPVSYTHLTLPTILRV